MRLRNRSPRTRRGVAAIEMAGVTIFFIVPMIIGIWEVGRLIHVQQVVANSAREGARFAAQGFTIKSDGTQIQIKRLTGTPNVKDVVTDYLRSAGLTTLAPGDVTVTFTFTTARSTNYTPIAGLDPVGTTWPTGTLPTEPCWGDKGETFTLFVSVPWDKVRWIDLGIVRPTTVSYTVTWRMLIDDEFQVNTTIPTW
jgi:Flp pilus assembly protein TadG